MPTSDREQLQAWSRDILPVFGNGDVQGLRESQRSMLEMHDYLRAIAAERRREPREDVLSMFMRAEAEGLVTEDEAVANCVLLLFAGHETTANMLALGTFALLEHPEQLAELRADPALLPEVVEELMRYLSVVDVFFRYATKDTEIAGETITKDSTVVVSLLAANRDPRRFDDADGLDLHRKARGQLAFGHGVHQCLGQQLARIEMRAGFDGLLRRFPSLRLAVAANEVRLRTDMSIYGVHELPVTWDS
jgi:cytochrome P450